MKKLINAALVLVVSSATVVLAADKSVTVKGEVVDTMCYASMGAGGEGHAKCGIGCAKKGVPIGLVDGAKKMYILLPGKDDTPMPPAVVEHMGKVVTVTGKVYQSGGNSFLTVESVK